MVKLMEKGADIDVTHTEVCFCVRTGVGYGGVCVRYGGVCAWYGGVCARHGGV